LDITDSRLGEALISASSRFMAGGVNAPGPAVAPVGLSTFLLSDSDSKRWQKDHRDIFFVITKRHDKNDNNGASA
jgi:hypothetical protein